MPLKQINKSPSKRSIAEAKYNQVWMQNPKQFDPFNSAIKTHYFDLVAKSLPDVDQKLCVDLGSGFGRLSQWLKGKGAKVTAVDIAVEALDLLKDDPVITKRREFVPYTSLDDNEYDYVIAANLIAEIPPEEHRLFFSELARLVKPDGTIIVSTPLDIDSEDALDRFLYLAETELAIESIHFCYDRLYIRTMHLLKKIFGSQGWLERQNGLLKLLEKITRFLYDEAGISYVLIISKRRALFEPLQPAVEIPEERKAKKSVWE